MTTKEQITEVINDLIKTAKTLDHSTAAEVKNQIYTSVNALLSARESVDEVAQFCANNAAIAAHNERMEEVLTKLEKHTTAATSDGDNAGKALFLFNRICTLHAEKAKLCTRMGAKWFNSTLADEYNNTIYALLEEIEKLAGAAAESK